MITSFFLDLIRTFVSFLLSVLPTSSGFPDEVLISISTLFQQAQSLDSILPMRELFLVLGWIIAFEIAMLFVHFTFYIIKLVRGHG